MTQPSGRALVLALCLALASPACGEVTALDLTLVADPNVNSEQDLVSALAELQLVVDSPAGLYPLGAARKEADFEIVDEDSDGAAELVSKVGVAQLGRLPLIRLEQGGLADQPLELRLLGRNSKGEGVAAGGVKGVHFIPEQALPVQLPFNLKADYRPPRVTEVYPADGATGLLVGSISSVLVIFSKAMNPVEVARPGVFSVYYLSGGKEVVVPAKSIKVTELYSQGPSKAEYTFVKLLDRESTFHVRIESKARDTSGRPLDQVPLQAGNQAFKSTFTLGPQMARPATTELAWCDNGGSKCSPGLACDTASKDCLPTGCPASCASLQVCDPSLGACVDDCRLHGTYGGCPAARPVCQKSGLCAE